MRDQITPIELSVTSDHEYYGPIIPRVFGLLREKQYDDATPLNEGDCTCLLNPVVRQPH